MRVYCTWLEVRSSKRSRVMDKSMIWLVISQPKSDPSFPPISTPYEAHRRVMGEIPPMKHCSYIEGGHFCLCHITKSKKKWPFFDFSFLAIFSFRARFRTRVQNSTQNEKPIKNENRILYGETPYDFFCLCHITKSKEKGSIFCIGIYEVRSWWGWTGSRTGRMGKVSSQNMFIMSNLLDDIRIVRWNLLEGVEIKKRP